tara:strand:+ start:259 stop:723 length:465 start_codon:yes stop_codon:yes gene_type:complete
MYLFICLHIIIINIKIDQTKLVSNVLDNLHKYASQANGKLYFDLFHDDAIFFGTDAKERWNKKDFEDYAYERFDNGDGWTYYTISRNIYFNEDKNTAWFDEELKNEKYGVFRGTGVLTKRNNKWRINQYNLLLPIPNDLLIKYSKEIKLFLDND